MRKYELTINDKAFTVDVKEFSTETAVIEVNGTAYNVEINDVINTQGPTAAKRPVARKVAAAPAAAAPAPSSGGAGAVTAPIPGSIMEVYVKEGDTVAEGQKILKMEAMKMENIIITTVGGTVTAIKVAAGDTVNQGQEMVVIG